MSITVLNTCLTNLQTKLAEATANPKPSYSIDGQSVSWGDYLDMLMRGIEKLQDLIARADPVSRRSVMG